MSANDFAGVPKPVSQFLQPNGQVDRTWWRFLFSLVSEPQKESVITPIASPFSYTASVNGTLLVQGGTVSAIDLKRLNNHTTGQTNGLFPLSVGDILMITYAVAPTLTWLPR